MNSRLGALLVAVCLVTVRADAPACRDRFLWPFSNKSIWNTPIGSAAVFVPANIYHTAAPTQFHNDQDLIVRAFENDPETPWMDQGDWGPSDKCAVVGPNVLTIPFPHNFTSGSREAPPGQINNNAAGLLLVDNRTLVQMQPLYRCEPGGPILARWGPDRGCPNPFPNVTDILGDGALGSHGGSGLSGIGGTIRVGEFSSDAPISHALKIELYAHQYYYGVKPLHPITKENQGRTQYVWPATGSDSYTWDTKVPTMMYNGTNPALTQGSLLAIPQSIDVPTKTKIGDKLKQALTQYGAYIVDDTASDMAAICMEPAVNDELVDNFGINMAYPNGLKSGPVFDDLVALFQSLHVVTNNSPTSIGGGGDPLAPYAPPICE
mmetsp:Transcript_3439/g.8200  ORF Transcript_3439/g.8200 Transcript_3439/m.8200 type:complete len:378 (+) Transcript_3439:2-1135(+)